MQIINLLDQKEKESFSGKLNKSLESCNLNILLGSGFSIPVLSSLGNIENELTTAKKNNDKTAVYETEKSFFNSCIMPLKNTSKIIESSPLRNSFLHSFVNIVAARHSSVLHKTINIFTTNYDNLIETCLEDKNVDYFDGFSGRITSIFSTNNYGKLIAKQSAINNKTSELVSVNLIKLHGSLYWCANNGKIVYGNFFDKIEQLEKIIDKPDEFIEAYESSFLIVNPNAEKYNLTVLNSNYYDQLRTLGNELEKSNTLLIAFGFSFNDEHLKQIIDRALENPTLTLVIFAYKEDLVISYKQKFINFGNVIVLYTATINEREELIYSELTLKDAGTFLEDIYYAISTH